MHQYEFELLLKRLELISNFKLYTVVYTGSPIREASKLSNHNHGKSI